jgi:hypothetical protein
MWDIWRTKRHLDRSFEYFGCLPSVQFQEPQYFGCLPSVQFQQSPSTSAVSRQYNSNRAPVLRLSPVSTIPTEPQYFGCLPSVPFQHSPSTAAVSRQYNSNNAPHPPYRKTTLAKPGTLLTAVSFRKSGSIGWNSTFVSVGFEAFFKIRHINSYWSSQEYL